MILDLSKLHFFLYLWHKLQKYVSRKLKSAKKIGFYNLKYKYSSDFDYFYRMIVKHKMIGLGTKRSEIFGNFRRGGFSSNVNFKDHFKETIKIRLDNGQNKLIIFLIILAKFLKNINKFF